MRGGWESEGRKKLLVQARPRQQESVHILSRAGNPEFWDLSGETIAIRLAPACVPDYTRRAMHVGVLTLELRLPGCRSLKEKRSRLKPLLAGLHREFNLSAAEIEQNDHHMLARLACAVVANETAHVERVLAQIPAWVETHRPDIQVLDHEVAFL